MALLHFSIIHTVLLLRTVLYSDKVRLRLAVVCFLLLHNFIMFEQFKPKRKNLKRKKERRQQAIEEKADKQGFVKRKQDSKDKKKKQKSDKKKRDIEEKASTSESVYKKQTIKQTLAKKKQGIKEKFNKREATNRKQIAGENVNKQGVFHIGGEYWYEQFNVENPILVRQPDIKIEKKKSGLFEFFKNKKITKGKEKSTKAGSVTFAIGGEYWYESFNVAKAYLQKEYISHIEEKEYISQEEKVPIKKKSRLFGFMKKDKRKIEDIEKKRKKKEELKEYISQEEKKIPIKKKSGLFGFMKKDEPKIEDVEEKRKKKEVTKKKPDEKKIVKKKPKQKEAIKMKQDKKKVVKKKSKQKEVIKKKPDEKKHVKKKPKKKEVTRKKTHKKKGSKEPVEFAIGVEYWYESFNTDKPIIVKQPITQDDKKESIVKETYTPKPSTKQKQIKKHAKKKVTVKETGKGKSTKKEEDKKKIMKDQAVEQELICRPVKRFEKLFFRKVAFYHNENKGKFRGQKNVVLPKSFRDEFGVSERGACIIPDWDSSGKRKKKVYKPPFRHSVPSVKWYTGREGKPKDISNDIIRSRFLPGYASRWIGASDRGTQCRILKKKPPKQEPPKPRCKDKAVTALISVVEVMYPLLDKYTEPPPSLVASDEEEQSSPTASKDKVDQVDKKPAIGKIKVLANIKLPLSIYHSKVRSMKKPKTKGRKLKAEKETTKTKKAKSKTKKKELEAQQESKPNEKNANTEKVELNDKKMNIKETISLLRLR